MRHVDTKEHFPELLQAFWVLLDTPSYTNTLRKTQSDKKKLTLINVCQEVLGLEEESEWGKKKAQHMQDQKKR